MDPKIKEVTFYLCNKSKKIADGKCNGHGCFDRAESDPGYCNHTTDPKYALYDPEKDDTNPTVWETVVLDDMDGSVVVSVWEREIEKLYN